MDDILILFSCRSNHLTHLVTWRKMLLRNWWSVSTLLLWRKVGAGPQAVEISSQTTLNHGDGSYSVCHVVEPNLVPAWIWGSWIMSIISSNRANVRVEFFFIFFWLGCIIKNRESHKPINKSNRYVTLTAILMYSLQQSFWVVPASSSAKQRDNKDEGSLDFLVKD